MGGTMSFFVEKTAAVPRAIPAALPASAANTRAPRRARTAAFPLFAETSRHLARLCVTAAFLTVCLVSASPAGAARAAGDAAPPEGKFEYMKRFTKAFDLVRGGYVHEVTNEELMDGAIKGMLQNLDPHSTFLNKKDYKEMQETTSGEFFGIGIEISTENNQLIVVSPIEDTPAYKAGLKAGDVILAVDGQPTQDMSTQEAVSKIRGAKGTEVELLILSKAAKAPREVKIVRAAIPLISVKSRFLDEEGYLWVRLTRFSDRTTQELMEALHDSAKKAAIKGIVLDLRNNPGGLLKQSVSVSDVFLKNGVVVSMRGRNNQVLESYDAKSSDTDVTCPVVVLVNSGTASASEIVAGALQDHNRAVIMGEQTFGKGSVQNVIPLGDGTAVKLTIALYYTPNGRSIQAKGIVPDIEVPFEPPREDAPKISRFNGMREKDLSRHLENGEDGGAGENRDKDGAVAPAKSEKTKKDKPSLVEDDTKTALEKDNQLRMGLQMVRGLPKIIEVQFR